MTSFHYMEELRKPCPCDGCSKFMLCKTQLKACKQFFFYVNSGRIVHGVKQPTRKIWQKIFVEDTDDEKEQQKKATVKITKEKIRQKLKEKAEGKV